MTTSPWWPQISRFLAVLPLSCGLLLGAPLARAQEDAPSAEAVKKAASEFNLGKNAFRDQDFGEAAEHFEAADDSVPSANAIRAAMTSRQRAGQLDRAATLAALAKVRHPNDAKLVEEANTILAEVKSKLHRVSVSCDLPCRLVVGVSLVHGAMAIQRVVYLDPGSHELRASWTEPEGTRTQAINTRAGGETNISFERPDAAGGVVEAPTEPDATEPDPPEGGKVTGDEMDRFDDDDPPMDEASKPGRGGAPPAVFVVGVVATAALGGVTTWSGLDTLNNPGKNEVVLKCQELRTKCDLYEEGQRKELRTNILAGATAGVGVITLVVGGFLTDWRRSAHSFDARSARRVEPYVTIDGGAMFGATGRF